MPKNLFEKIQRFLLSDDGPTAVEYAVMLLGVILACMTAIQFLGQSTGDCFQDSSDKISNAMGSG